MIIANPVEVNTPTVAGQAAASASAPVNAGTVLLTDSDDRCTPPASTHRQIRTCPPRAKGFLNRRFEWFSLVTFFLQKKKVTRAGARNAPSRARRQCPPIPRRRQPPPTHCGASRRNGRDLIIATRPAHQPLPSLLSAAAAQEVQAIPRTDNVPRCTNSARSAPPILHNPQRVKGPLDRRSKRLSFPHFFLRRKKCGRRRPPPRQGKANSPPGRRNPPRAKGSLNRRSKWFSLVTFF